MLPRELRGGQVFFSLLEWRRYYFSAMLRLWAYLNREKGRKVLSSDVIAFPKQASESSQERKTASLKVPTATLNVTGTRWYRMITEGKLFACSVSPQNREPENFLSR